MIPSVKEILTELKEELLEARYKQLTEYRRTISYPRDRVRSAAWAKRKYTKAEALKYFEDGWDDKPNLLWTDATSGDEEKVKFYWINGDNGEVIPGKGENYPKDVKKYKEGMWESVDQFLSEDFIEYGEELAVWAEKKFGKDALEKLQSSEYKDLPKYKKGKVDIDAAINVALDILK